MKLVRNSTGSIRGNASRRNLEWSRNIERCSLTVKLHHFQRSNRMKIRTNEIIKFITTTWSYTSWNDIIPLVNLLFYLELQEGGDFQIYQTNFSCPASKKNIILDIYHSISASDTLLNYRKPKNKINKLSRWKIKSKTDIYTHIGET